MAPEVHLLIHNVGSIVSSVLIFGLAIFIIVNNPRSRTALLFAGTLLSAVVFVVSHVIGVNIADPLISRNVLMFNLSIMFIGSFYLHCVLALINVEKKFRIVIFSLYIIPALISIFFLLYPDLFLLPSVPKMYFPNYYEPGLFNWIRVAFLYGICVPAGLILSFIYYRKSVTIIEKKQLWYFMLAVVVGFALGFIPNFLIYGVEVDPVLGIAFFSVFTIPLIYGAVHYELFNIKVIAKQAFLYGLTVAASAFVIVFLTNATSWLEKTFPQIPIWAIPITSAVLAVTIGVAIWQRLSEETLLKNEFLNVVTHKFRTPLTHIKWAAENLEASKLDEDQRVQVGYIAGSNSKLVELTNLLVNVAGSEGVYQYHFEISDLSLLIEDVLQSSKQLFSAKKIHWITDIAPHLRANIDLIRLKFVLQTFIENAIHYSKEPVTVHVAARRERGYIHVSVTDNGIGISPEEMPRLFNKFWRSHAATLADTEGLGIGLFISKDIIERHGGHISGISKGLNRGSTFEFTLKEAK